MKVTLAANHGEIGGGEVMLLAIAEALRDGGHDVAIVAPGEPDAVAQAALAQGFPTTTIDARSTAGYLAGLRRWDARERTGLLWCNGLRPALATAAHADRIVHLHQQPQGIQTVAARLASCGARRVLVPSQTLHRLIPGSITLENWTTDISARQSTREPRVPVVLGFLGRPSVDKGVTVLAEALALLEGQNPGAYRLLLAGESRFVSPDAEREVEAALAPVSDLVDRPGWMARDAFFDSVNLLVSPSIAPESFGLSVAESMAAGVSVVVSDTGALPEVVGEGYPWVVPAGDPASLARAIQAAAADPHRSELTDRLRSRWQTHYSPSAGAHRLERLMSELAKEPPP